MFAAHFAVALAAKRVAPRVSLGTLALAAQWVDLLWPTLLLLGVERVRIEPGATASNPLVFEHYPWSHSLAAVLVWALVFAVAHFAARRDPSSALVLAALVLSHWLLDAVVHVPDLPLTPGGPVIGAGLWNHKVVALALEFALLAGAALVYVRTTTARDRRGRWGFAGFVAFLALIQLANAGGEPPPSVAAIAWVGQAQWLPVAWAYWIDRHRSVRGRFQDIASEPAR
jgi:type IV secretory pathway TrbD component